MSLPHDPFALSFDSIELDPTRAPPREAIERAMSVVGPRHAQRGGAEQPGFTLIDDAGGRFVVDREFGVVSLTGEYVLTAEAGAVHAVRLRVVEQSGAAYEIDMRLKITGMVPSMVGAEDIDLLLSGGDASPAPAHVQEAPAPRAPALPWAAYAAFAGQSGQTRLAETSAPFGALVAPAPLPHGVESARLHLFTPLPAPAPAHAAWSL